MTSFLEMPNTRPLTTTQEALDDKLQRASNKCLVNYGFFIGATADNLSDRQDKPSWVTAEVTPQHLVLNTSAYQEIGTLAQMNPPLRSPHDNQVLWQSLRDGFIDFIATHIAPLAERNY